jgi:hypothetical protein
VHEDLVHGRQYNKIVYSGLIGSVLQWSIFLLGNKNKSGLAGRWSFSNASNSIRALLPSIEASHKMISGRLFRILAVFLSS